MSDIELLWKMALLFAAIFLALYLWLTHLERRALSDWRQYAKDRGYPDAKIRGDLPPVEYENVLETELDNGLDLAKVHVIDVPLKEAQFGACACMGPIYGEPFCPCEMKRKGLPCSAGHIEAHEKAVKQWRELVNSGAFTKTREQP